MAKLTPEEINEIKNAVKPFTPKEIAEGKAERDAIWASELVAPPVAPAAEVVAEAEEPPAGVPQGATEPVASPVAPAAEVVAEAEEPPAGTPLGAMGTRARGGRRKVEPKSGPEVNGT